MNRNGDKPESQRGNFMLAFVFVFMFCVPTAFFFGSALEKVERERLIASDPVTTTAEVVDVERVSDGARGYNWVPTVELESGAELVRVDLESIGDKDRYVEGDEISVTYQQGNPATAVETSRRDEVRNVMILPSIFVAIELTVAIVAIVDWYRFRRRFYRKQRMVET